MIPRVYTNKPRTKGTGYKGLLHNPNPEAADDMLGGVKAIRRMHLRVVEETGTLHGRRDALSHELPVPHRPARLHRRGSSLR